MAKPETKKKMKGFKEFDASKYIDLEPTLAEAVKSNTVVMTFGRMNPMTIGHEKLVEKLLKEAQEIYHILLTKPTRRVKSKK